MLNIFTRFFLIRKRWMDWQQHGKTCCSRLWYFCFFCLKWWFLWDASNVGCICVFMYRCVAEIWQNITWKVYVLGEMHSTVISMHGAAWLHSRVCIFRDAYNVDSISVFMWVLQKMLNIFNIFFYKEEMDGWGTTLENMLLSFRQSSLFQFKMMISLRRLQCRLHLCIYV